MNWQVVEDLQKEVCRRINVEWTPVDTNMMIAVSSSLFSPLQPINGLRHSKERIIDGWYLWSGGEIPQDNEKFFSSIHAHHLIEQRPLVLKYLGLPYGWRFQIDDKGYEDVWFDSGLLNI